MFQFLWHQEALQLEQRLHRGQLVALRTAELFKARDARRSRSEAPRRTPAPEPCPQR